MTASKVSKTWVEIDAEALTSNIKSLQSLLNPGVVFCAVVKANAYGHELEQIVRLAKLQAIEHFAVDSIDEAIRLRKVAASATIFVLGFSLFERYIDIVKHDLIQTIYDEESVAILAKEAIAQQKIAKVNIKIETGTQRQGISVKKLDPLLREIRRYERFVEVVGISSHYADAERTTDPSFTREQTAVFAEALDIVEGLGFHPIYQHIACSAAGIAHPGTQGTMVRFGIALYGLWSSEELRRTTTVGKRSIELRPVLAWKTHIAQIKDVPSKTSVGYGRSYITDRPIRIAVLPVGYYDGYRRISKSKGFVLIKGQRCPIIGTICMNMMMVDVSVLPSVKAGDIVTLLGRDGMHEISAEELAENMQTINYEVVTQINPLLPRIVV